MEDDIIQVRDFKFYAASQSLRTEELLNNIRFFLDSNSTITGKFSFHFANMLKLLEKDLSCWNICVDDQKLLTVYIGQTNNY